MARDKEQTKARILVAVGKLLAESGFRQLGINAIAQEAGVDKVLIYRYFGSLPSLLQAFGQEGNYWPSVEDLVAGVSVNADASRADWATQLLIQLLHELQKRPTTQEILRWEILEGNELTQELAIARNRVATESLRLLAAKFGLPKNQDLSAISAILVAGIVYLVLRSKANPTFLGIDFRSPQGWQRIEQAATSIIQSTFQDKLHQENSDR
jgi:AcrR family transcriptional regulator